MEFTTDMAQPQAIIDLFRATFTASEGAEEGAVIGDFVTALLSTTPAEDIFVFSALEEGTVHACAIFTRLRFAEDARRAFILSPMAVATAQQGRGLGQKLLRHAFEQLRGAGVDVALTYGDINFYGRVGYQQIDEAMAQAPLPLSYPEGWLAQSLTDAELTPLQGAATCVPALNDPALW
ncbi:GNAT family N-acetyltransferase [Roseibaca sp. Y0-43]|uniref:GNAT family N-acetyltransferase n=1 Tax=Roseibaca sp. Y0-43 TaxID=2816854 RepID=UPI001D0CA10F|nr:N-acetyltransferase [Roseibaca sp. Y0-43]MCC1482586.1 N-acetyltransferase [Roseibaca sp. Y0-43]